MKEKKKKEGTPKPPKSRNAFLHRAAVHLLGGGAPEEFGLAAVGDTVIGKGRTTVLIELNTKPGRGHVRGEFFFVEAALGL